MIKHLKSKKIIFVFFFFAVSTMVMAQQESLYTQYMYNTVMFNPAYAGSREKMTATTLYRTQWVGLEGAPTTINASLESPLGSGLGFAVNILNDKIGPKNQNNIGVNLSYYIALNEIYTLYFGVRGSADFLNVDFAKLNIENPSDPSLVNIENRFSPNVGFGLYLRSENSYVGISMPSMLETLYYKSSQISMAKERQHVYLMFGNVFDLSYNVKFKPAALMKIASSSPTQLDLSLNFLYNEKFTFGMAYRWNAAVSGLAGFQVSDKILAGYAYDFSTSKLGKYAQGSHEFFLQFDLFNYTKTNRANSRFF